MPSSSDPRRNQRGAGANCRIGASNSEIIFIFTYDKKVRVKKIRSSESVSIVSDFIMRMFDIPVHRQLVFGWPGNVGPGSSKMKLRELHLPNTVKLSVAMTGEPEKDSSVAGPSRRLMKTDNKKSEPDDTVRLTVFDAVNEQSYDLPFRGRQTVGDVKRSVGELTGIQPEVRSWDGWPQNTKDDLMLIDLKLEKPSHFLVITVLDTPTGSAAPAVNRVISDLIPVSEEEPAIMGIVVPKPTARKSTTKGVLKEFQERLNRRWLLKSKDVATPKVATGSANPVRLGMKKHCVNRSGIIPPFQTADGFKSVGVHQPVAVANGANLNGQSKTALEEAMDCEVQPSTSKRPRMDFSQFHLILSPNELDPTLLNLPKRASNKILDWLTPLEQLSLRRTCKGTNGWVNRKQEDITPEEEEKWKNHHLIIARQGLNTFQSVMKMGLPITKYTFAANGEDFYEDDQLPDFLTSVGLRVKDFTLQCCYMFQNANEHGMLQALLNLEKLTINKLVSSSKFTTPNACPSTLRNLTTLKLNYGIPPPENNKLIRPRAWDLTWSMLHDSQNLIYFRFPKIVEKGEDYLAGVFGPLNEYLEIRSNLGTSTLEILDFKNLFDPESDYNRGFLELMRNCHAKNIKLKNIHANIVQQLLTDNHGFDEDSLEFCKSVVSLVNYQPFAEIAPLENLEKISVDVAESAFDFASFGRSYKNVFWRKLSTIKVKDTLQEWAEEVQRGWNIIEEDLYGLGMEGERASVKYISIDSPMYPFFLSEGRLAQVFGNVTRLRISAWCWSDDPVTLNKRLIPIWKKLRLEELDIENCPKLDDYSFIGSKEDREGDRNSPVFLKLASCLKTFTLDLEATGVTDRVFTNVFSRMRFKTFKLLSSDPANISEKALLSLLSGEFGKHIERFSFDTWNSSTITPNRFAELEKQFRSMI